MFSDPNEHLAVLMAFIIGVLLGGASALVVTHGNGKPSYQEELQPAHIYEVVSVTLVEHSYWTIMKQDAILKFKLFDLSSRYEPGVYICDNDRKLVPYRK